MTPSTSDAGIEGRIEEAPDAFVPSWADPSGPPDSDERDGDAPVDASAARPAAPVADAQLVRWIAAVVERDDRALASLYDATCARVFALVRRIVRSEALADEVVEDAYFQVWRQAARFSPGRGPAMAWLLTMARSRAIDALRNEARAQHEPLNEEQWARPGEPTPGCDELVDSGRHHAELHRALMLLGAQPRQMVSLSFFRGLTHEEIASQMALPLGTVKSQIRRALLTLRKALDPAARRCAA